MSKINRHLKRYIPIADMVAKTFGRNCEVVIHDLSIPQNSVVYTVNSHVTGRKEGQSFDHLVKQVLLSRKFDGDYTANYRTTTEDQREIKSSTALIRNTKNDVVGALCINYDLSLAGPLKAFADDFFAMDEEEPEDEIEPVDNVVEIVDDLIEKIISNVDTDSLKKKEKVQLIEFMESKGIFLIKGAIDKVADKLNISRVTVYSYLDEIKKNEFDF